MAKNKVSDLAAFKLDFNINIWLYLIKFEKAFTVTFLDSSEDQAELDLLESKWTNKLQAKILWTEQY